MQYFPRLIADSARPSARVFLLIVCLVLSLSSGSVAVSINGEPGLERSIIDYRSHLNPLYKKTQRERTKYIIVHTSETDLETTLKIVLEGKQDGDKWITRGGHAHYVIARDGQTFLSLAHEVRANHAGLSMWNGEIEISSISVGIELVAYHDGDITESQYHSIRNLIGMLKRIYHLDDLAVLTHSQVAYAYPNQWVSSDHRGRKNCARNFNRARAGLGPTWPYDPDVRSGRLLADPKLASIFYGQKFQTPSAQVSHVMDQNRSAWAIAGDKFDSPDTIYKLPDGWFISGNRIHHKIGWDRLPAGTEIFFD